MDTDLAFFYDYGGSAARIHVFLADPANTEFDYQGDAGWWGVASGYDLDKVVHAVAGDWNGDGDGDIATVYDYGVVNEKTHTRIHVFGSTGSSFNYSGPEGWWKSPGSYNSRLVKHAADRGSRLRDADEDKLINLAEVRLSTDPYLADTDVDGFGDGIEVYVTTNPLAACGPDAWPPDLRGTDNTINSSDFNPILANWQQTVPPAPVRYDISPWSGASPDKKISSSDFNPILARWQQSCQ